MVVLQEGEVVGCEEGKFRGEGERGGEMKWGGERKGDKEREEEEEGWREGRVIGGVPEGLGEDDRRKEGRD